MDSRRNPPARPGQGQATGRPQGEDEPDSPRAGMNKALFEAMISRALNRGQPAPAPSADIERNSDESVPVYPESRRKGRPQTARDKSAAVLERAARGMTRQAIADDLGISLASVYRILRDNR